jgi:hypothetical protein
MIAALNDSADKRKYLKPVLPAIQTFVQRRPKHFLFEMFGSTVVAEWTSGA